MKERPILFNADMVRAILDGRKTQTRRMVKPQPLWVADPSVPFSTPDADPRGIIKSLFGTVGDRLWVRETTCIAPKRFATPDDTCLTDDDGDKRYVSYKADGHSEWAMRDYNLKWTPSIHVPRWASRIDLEITAVRVERLQEITEADAKKEGVDSVKYGKETFWKAYGKNLLPEGGELVATRAAAQSFHTLWQSIYGNWDANPWVWVYEFRRVE
jgi:hypothetical protein